MNTSLFKTLILPALLFTLTVRAENIPDRKLMTAFRENPYRSAAGHAPYEAPAEDIVYSTAPEGYKAFYISHFGRHGSRTQSSESVYSKVCTALDKMLQDDLLTPHGDSLRKELHAIWDIHKYERTGMLTQKGAREHRGIAERMCRRNPEIFTQNDRREVSCRSTVVTRCVESMGNFAVTVQGFNPTLDITMRTDLLTGRTDGAPDPKEIRDLSGPVVNAMLDSPGYMPSLAARLFTDFQAAAEHVEDEDMGRFLLSVFQAAAGAGCLDEDFDPLRFFTTEELLACNKIRNIHFASSYGCFGLTRDINMRHSFPYAMLMIEEADEAIEGNGHCADLRFAHDKQVGPLLSLLDLENYNVYTPAESSHNHMAAWKYLSMATNMQMIFYRDSRNDILVKFLCNERESVIPSLEVVGPCFHRWSDVRSHIISRIGRK